MREYGYPDYDYEDDVEYVDYYEEDIYELPTGEAWEEEEEDPASTSQFSLSELYEYCVVPTLTDSTTHLYNILLWSFIFTVTTRIVRVPAFLTHLSSMVCGGVVGYSLFGPRIYVMVALVVVAGTTLTTAHYIIKSLRGPLTCLACVVFMIVCELWLVDAVAWHSIRGPQMVIVMKVVSVAFDLDATSLPTLPDPLETLGYVSNPGTLIFGPWISLSSYRKLLQPMTWSVALIPAVLVRLLSSCIFLLMSTCYTSWLIPDSINKWGAAYRDALSFRSSHYFVSYFSEASAVLSGLELGRVTAPTHIELPRSLVQVVVYWNMPMHYWLKTYIFKPAKARLGNFCAILFTYVMSALFHGLNFQLAAVLLSLGFYTYVEHSLRVKLAAVFDACVLARPCSQSCTHHQKGWSAFSLLVNFIFGAVASFHLAYLGIMFDASSQDQESGYSMAHTLAKWSKLNFVSHWLVFICYIMYAVI